MLAPRWCSQNRLPRYTSPTFNTDRRRDRFTIFDVSLDRFLFGFESSFPAAEVEAGAYGYTDGGFKYGGYVEEDNYNYAATNSYNPYGYGRSKQGLKVIGGGGVHGHIGHKTNAEMDHDYYPMEHEASEYGYAKLQGGYYDKAKGTLYSDGTSKVTPTGAVAGHKMSGNLYSTGYGRVQTAGGATAKSEDDYY